MVSVDFYLLLLYILFCIVCDGGFVDLYLVCLNFIVCLIDVFFVVLSVIGFDSYILFDWYDLMDQVLIWNYVVVYIKGLLECLLD